MKKTIRAFAPLLAAALMSLSASAQEPEIPEQFKPQPGGDMVEELTKLFQEVERNLQLIDIQLADAGAGEVPLEDVGDSGLDKLLRDSQDKSEEVIAGIDRILEIAQQMGSSMGSGMGQPQDQQGESPLDQERDKGPQNRENTPEAPGDKPKDQQQGEEPQPEGEDPKSPKDNPQEGDNRTGDPRQDEAGAPVTPGDDVDKWGFLPDRVREKFRNQGADELPVRYRDWIDSYYRRLNVRSGR